MLGDGLAILAIPLLMLQLTRSPAVNYHPAPVGRVH
jgi:hypothetical protein